MSKENPKSKPAQVPPPRPTEIIKENNSKLPTYQNPPPPPPPKDKD